MKLEDLLKAKPVKPNEWFMKNKPLHIILTETNALMSYFIYNLMFRFEGEIVGNSRVNIYVINDNKKVKESDTRVGLYVNNDIGKNRADVLVNRYGNVFTSPVIKVDNVKNLIKDFKKERYERNTLIVGSGKKISNSTKLFKKLLKDTQVRSGGLARIHGTSNGNNLTVINTINRIYGGTLGEMDSETIKTTKKKVSDIVIENQMLSQTMLNCLNLLVTDDSKMGGLPYLTWDFNRKTNEQKNIYNTKEITLFHLINRYKFLEVNKKIPEDRLYEMNNLYKNMIDKTMIEYESKKMKYVTKKLEKDGFDSLINQTVDIWSKLLEVQVKNVDKRKLFISELEDYYNKVIMVEILKQDDFKEKKETKEQSKLNKLRMIDYFGWKITENM